MSTADRSRPAVGIAHLTVVPANYEESRDDDDRPD